MTYEDRPEKDTPVTIQTMLAEYGGRVPDGRPLWRLVLAQNCRMQCFGVMRHAPPVKDTSNLDLKEVEAERVEEGAFWIPRYKVEGWILQRWFPANIWGTRFDWEQERAEDGKTRVRGRYPENGDYYMLAGPWTSIEAAGDVRKAIQQVTREQASNPTNFDSFFREQMRAEKQERAEAVERYTTTLEIYQRTQVLPVLQGTTATAQRVRNRIQQQIGSGTHMGASELWAG